MEQIGDTLKRFPLRKSSAEGLSSLAEEPALRCTICGDSRWVRVDVPVEHPRFGEVAPCVCWEHEDRVQRTARLLRYSNLGALARFTFASLDPAGRSPDPQDQRMFQEAAARAHSFAEEPRGWLVLVGPSGCGKTHLAAAIAQRVVELGRPALFMVAPDLLDHLRSAYAPESADAYSYDLLFDQVREAPLLVLDDLGAQASTPWAQEKLFQLFNHRYNLELPTVVTLSVSFGALEERLRTRLTDRPLSHVCEVGRLVPSTARLVGMPPAPMLEEMTFARFDTRGGHVATPDQQDTLQYALRAAQSFARDPHDAWLVLSGPTGVGKTHLAVAIVNHRREQGQPVFYATVPDLLDHLRAAFAPRSPVSYDERFEQLRTAPLLVLDDLGTQGSTPWAEEKLYQLLVYRHDARLSTVITRGALELDPHIASRLNSRLKDERVVTSIPMRAPDYREHGRLSPSPRRRPRRNTAASHLS